MLKSLKINAVHSGHHELFKNFISGSLVFFIAVPLCLGIALASGAPPIAGLIAGVVGGLIVGTMSGSAIGVSGPAAGLTLVILGGFEDLGQWQLVAIAIAVSGVWQVFAGVLRLGFISHYFPIAVVEGLLAAIGLILMKQQLTELGSAVELQGSNFIQMSYFAFFVCLLAIWPHMRNYRWLARVFPAPLVVIVISTVMTTPFFLEILPAETRFVTIQIPDVSSLLDLSPLNFQYAQQPILEFADKILLLSLTIAVVGSLETLLSVEAADRLDPKRRITPSSRELFSQGVGNIISGLLGGLPITQVIVRSSANVEFGATNKSSTVLHGFLIFLMLAAFSQYLELIPKIGLSALLFFIGYQLVSFKKLKHMYLRGFNQFLPFATTLIAVVLTDILTGISFGLTVSLLLILKRQYDRNYQQKISEDGKTIEIQFPQEMSFFHKGRLIKLFKEISPESHLILNGSQTLHMDGDVVEVIQTFLQVAPKSKIHVEVKGLEKWLLSN